MKILHERERSCGYRTEGYYLIAGGKPVTCFCLPIRLVACSHCGLRPRFSRTVYEISPYYFQRVKLTGKDCRFCFIGKAKFFVSCVGSDYSVEGFLLEGRQFGTFSRRLNRPLVLPEGSMIIFTKQDKAALTAFAVAPYLRTEFVCTEETSTKKIHEAERAGAEVVRVVPVKDCQMEFF